MSFSSVNQEYKTISVSSNPSKRWSLQSHVEHTIIGIFLRRRPRVAFFTHLWCFQKLRFRGCRYGHCCFVDNLMLGLMSCLRILLTFGRRLPLIFSACSDLLHRRGRPPRPQSGLSIRVSRFWILLRIERTCCTQPCVGRNHSPISSTNYSTEYQVRTILDF